MSDDELPDSQASHNSGSSPSDSSSSSRSGSPELFGDDVYLQKCLFCRTRFDPPLSVDLLAVYQDLLDVNARESTSTKLKSNLSLPQHASFCTAHSIGAKARLEGEKNGWPVSVDWEEFEQRARNILPNIDKIAAKPSSSRFYKDFKDFATGAKDPDVSMITFDAGQPGYYGPKGFAVLFSVLQERYLKTGSKSCLSGIAHPERFVKYCLVNELGLRLIGHDQYLDLDDAEDTLYSSRNFGRAVHPLSESAESDSDESSDHDSSIVGAKASLLASDQQQQDPQSDSRKGEQPVRLRKPRVLLQSQQPQHAADSSAPSEDAHDDDDAPETLDKDLDEAPGTPQSASRETEEADDEPPHRTRQYTTRASRAAAKEHDASHPAADAQSSSSKARAAPAQSSKKRIARKSGGSARPAKRRAPGPSASTSTAATPVSDYEDDLELNSDDEVSPAKASKAKGKSKAKSSNKNAEKRAQKEEEAARAADAARLYFGCDVLEVDRRTRSLGTGYFYRHTTRPQLIKKLAELLGVQPSVLDDSQLGYYTARNLTSSSSNKNVVSLASATDYEQFQQAASSQSQSKSPQSFVLVVPKPPNLVSPATTSSSSSSKGKSAAKLATKSSATSVSKSASYLSKADKSIADVTEQLLERYNKGSCSVHPDVHCYKDQQGRHFELSGPPLTTWAVAILEGNNAATLSDPPNNTYFDAQRAIKTTVAPKTQALVPWASETPAYSALPVPPAVAWSAPPSAAFSRAPHHAPPPPAAPMHSPYPAAPPPFAYTPHPALPPPPGPPSLSLPGHSAASTSTDATLPPELVDFCSLHKLHAGTARVLDKLGINVGDVHAFDDMGGDEATEKGGEMKELFVEHGGRPLQWRPVMRALKERCEGLLGGAGGAGVADV
ncbi:hypothetical protein Rhopal_003616-T1 [Rhodotorula paludigena]|uniref:Restriction of telomere capping protein 4 n=1 Tax=Rhodotorula paludigena TaxID=86838 RepID=A0AAV5GMY2_9BASI|nr:hypothetical protein Rhopal_003616-T1 [Rhodotorula paludigena]